MDPGMVQRVKARGFRSVPDCILKNHGVKECFGVEGTLKPISIQPLPRDSFPQTKLLQEVLKQGQKPEVNSLDVLHMPRSLPQFLGSDSQKSLPEAREALTWQPGTCRDMGLLLIIFPARTFPKETGKAACGSAPSPSPRSSGGDNEPFTHSQLQVLLVTLPICCHGCSAQERLGELIHGPLAGSSRSLRMAAAPLSAGCASAPAAGAALPGPWEAPRRRCQAGTRGCFLTRWKFFLFKALTFPRSPFPSPFVPQARSGCPRGDPNPLWVPRWGFPWSHARLGSSGKGSKAQLNPGTAPWFFLAKPVLVTPAIKSSGLTAADGWLRAGNKRSCLCRAVRFHSCIAHLFVSLLSPRSPPAHPVLSFDKLFSPRMTQMTSASHPPDSLPW